MKRLIVADTHLRDDVPERRKDDYLNAQWRKFRFILDTAKAYQCDEIDHVGDLLHKSSNETKSTFLAAIISLMRECKIPFLIRPGNHDCPNHREDRVMDGRMATLFAAIPNLRIAENTEEVEFYHTYVWHPDHGNNDKIPGISASDLMAKTKAPLILTGDNHQTFVFQEGRRVLINPGSMMRMTIDQRDFKPRIFIWNDGKISDILLPVEKDVWASEENKKTAIDSSMEHYVEQLARSESFDLDFRANMKSFLSKNPSNDEVESLIWRSLGE